jgi:Sulfotransferase domain
VTPKVFCIGFHKTGTTSLGSALRKLGYSVTGPNGTKDPDISRNVYPMAFALVEQYDAFQDNPWPIIYQDLDHRYPDSKFILTLRPADAWIRSQVRHFGTRETPMRKWIYGAGCPQGNEALYVERFERHNREVLSYFASRPGDLLVMDLVRGDGWDELCHFLEKPVPDIPFPHANQSQKREIEKGTLPQVMRRVGRAVKQALRDSGPPASGRG